MINMSFGKLESDGSKAIYMTDSKTHKRIFCFWFHVKNDNPNQLNPTQAVSNIIANAGYDDWRDFYETKIKTAK
jgi:hypothetical protein